MSAKHFFVGEKVVFASDNTILDSFKEQHGNGPFVVTKIKDFDAPVKCTCGARTGYPFHMDDCAIERRKMTLANVGHSQHITILFPDGNQSTFSGMFFAPFYAEP